MQIHHYALIIQNSEVVSGEPFPMVIEARSAADTRVSDFDGNLHVIVDQGMISPVLARNFKDGRWEGEVVVTGPGTVKIRVWDKQGVGEHTVMATEHGMPMTFPLEIECPGCQQTNIAGKIDVFRCIHCNAIYFIDKFGHVIPLKHGNASEVGYVKHIAFKIPSDVNYLNHVRNFIVGITSEENIEEEKISQIEMSLDEALANIVEHAYSFDPYQEIQVEAWLYSDKIEIVLRDHGRSFDSDNTPVPDLKKHIEERKVGGLGRYLIIQFMDEVAYHSDAHTNELKMIKRF